MCVVHIKRRYSGHHGYVESKMRYEHIFSVIDGPIDNWKNVFISNFNK